METDNPIQPADRFTLLRALAHLETDATVRGPDHLAQCYLETEWRAALAYGKALVRRFEATAPGAYAYGIARTRYFDAQVESAIGAGVRQVLVLGAGFDSRADRFSTEPPLTVFEVDRDPVLRTKAARRAAAGLPASSNAVHAVPADLARAAPQSWLAAPGLDPALPVLVLAEGVQYYLPPSFLDSVLDFLGQQTAPGSRLVLDHADPAVLEEQGADATLARFASHSGEPFLATCTPGQLGSLCAQRGLAVTDTLDHDAMCAAFLHRSDGSLVGLPYQGFYFSRIDRTMPEEMAG